MKKILFLVPLIHAFYGTPSFGETSIDEDKIKEWDLLQCVYTFQSEKDNNQGCCQENETLQIKSEAGEITGAACCKSGEVLSTNSEGNSICAPTKKQISDFEMQNLPLKSSADDKPSETLNIPEEAEINDRNANNFAITPSLLVKNKLPKPPEKSLNDLQAYDRMEPVILRVEKK